LRFADRPGSNQVQGNGDEYRAKHRFEEDVTTTTEADAYEWSWSPAAEAKMAVLRLAAEC
jgi:hypothetical protein